MPQAPASLQEQAESTALGRVVISALIVVILVSFITWDLPSSPLRSALEPVVDPFVRVTGLEQDWGVFAPNPRDITIQIVARVRFADGTSTTWPLPEGGPILDTYRIYRWDKYAEIVRRDDRSHLWEPLARYVSRRFEAAGRDVTSVTLVRRWYDIAPPGQPQGDPDWQAHPFYTLDHP